MLIFFPATLWPESGRNGRNLAGEGCPSVADRLRSKPGPVGAEAANISRFPVSGLYRYVSFMNHIVPSDVSPSNREEMPQKCLKCLIV